MALVRRFSIPGAEASGLDVFVSGVGLFARGTYDVPSADTSTVSAVRAIILAQGGIEIGEVDTAIAPPPVAGTGDPYPQYLSQTELAETISGGEGPVVQALKAASVSAVLADPAVRSTFGSRVPGVRAVIFGDSWAAIERNVAGTPNTYGGSVYSSARGWFTWANYWLRQRIDVVNNGGVTGQTSTQQLARFDTDVTPHAPDVVFIVSPVINDVRASVALDTITANVAAMLDKAAALNALVVTFTCPPLSAPSMTTAQLAIAHGYNHWIKEQASARRGVVLIDVHPALSDATDADDFLDKNASPTKFTADGTHLAPWGAARVGRLVYQALDPLIPRLDRLPFGGASVRATKNPNILTNPGLTGTAGTLNNGATGTLATGFVIASSTGAAFPGTVTASKVARTDQVGGDWQRVAITGTASNVLLYQLVDANNWDPGDTVEAMVEFAAGTDWVTPRLRFSLWASVGFGGSPALVMGYDIDPAQDSYPLAENPLGVGVFRTPKLTIPADATHLRFQVQFNGLGTFDIGRPAVLRLNR